MLNGGDGGVVGVMVTAVVCLIRAKVESMPFDCAGTCLLPSAASSL